MKIDMEKLLASINGTTKKLIDSLDKSVAPPGLIIFSDQTVPENVIYTRQKSKKCAEFGIDCQIIPIENMGDFDVLGQVRDMHLKHPSYGIMLQLPAPGIECPELIVNQIPWHVDVDGLSEGSVGALHNNSDVRHFVPCTPAGIMKVLGFIKEPLDGKHAVVVGRSNIVGQPVAKLLLDRNATVTICHSHTKDLVNYTLPADILVVAAGVPHLIKKGMVKPEAVVIDVGINRDEEGHIIGDCDTQDLEDNVRWITPVPGGIGKLTVAMLMQNTVYVARDYCSEYYAKNCTKNE